MDERKPVSNEAMADRFHYHAPSETGVQRHAMLSELFTALALEVRDVCPVGREQSLALTNLEQAKMWASAAVARNPDTR